METLPEIKENILNTLVDAYEKKGGGETYVAPKTAYRGYDKLDEPVKNIERFEAAANDLSTMGMVTLSWGKDKITRIRLVTSSVDEIYKFLKRPVRLKEDGISILEKDDLCNRIDVSFYKTHPSEYLKDRIRVLQLSEYFKNGVPKMPAAERERCYQIWHEEKMLSQSEMNGQRILDRCRIQGSALNTYKTFEPFAYRTFSEKAPQNVLFVENSATYCTLLKMSDKDTLKAFGMDFGTIVYGAGDRILAQIKGWDKGMAEQYLLNKSNRFYYFGDLDLSGINIFLSLRAIAPFQITPLKEAYMMMCAKEEKYLSRENKKGKMMPEKQKKLSTGDFHTYFTEEEWRRIRSLLMDGRLIPQEILIAEDMV